MKRFAIAALMACAAGAAMAGDGSHWTYEGEAGPEQWAKLSPDNYACSGKNQSPVDVKGTIHAALTPLKMDYHAGGNEVLNNGHTLQVGFQPGSSLMLDGERFELKQYHFHAPSENLIKGQSYPLEVHLVHADKDGNLAVVAVMFKEGAENKALTALWPQLPKEAGAKAALGAPLSAAALLPAKRAYYRFSGSLTTPPCSEGVRWLVMKAPVTVSKEQVASFAALIHHPNNRPVQSLNGRVILD
ncbi:carbonic anhydrase [Pseudoduganella namucuonensis]|uniref:Carbonic anhydrase n=1 Tax=Pseudoduganella namucuonensis TaxID=1035707 RepID=A0A1I7L4Z8_9BURK|nr:carbonic anhydrase family protein [Pseudoduganella namucuonensis]SFV04813.1 carbonic anhydrase [Pseudoduganella namucuonensis]